MLITVYSKSFSSILIEKKKTLINNKWISTSTRITRTRMNFLKITDSASIDLL